MTEPHQIFQNEIDGDEKKVYTSYTHFTQQAGSFECPLSLVRKFKYAFDAAFRRQYFLEKADQVTEHAIFR